MQYFHTALSVKNLQEAQKFYEIVFGLKLKTKGERSELGVKFIMLEEANSKTVIELFEHNQPAPLKEDLMDFQNVGIKHIAFIVEDIENTIEQAVKNNAKIIWPPKQGITVKRIAFIRDPNGIPIELVEL